MIAIVRHAVTSTGRRRGALSCLSSSSSPAISASAASNCSGMRRGLIDLSLKAPPAPAPHSRQQLFFSSRPKDKRLEAIEKSEQLHAELKEMIAAQKARQSEELQRPFGSNFLSFLKASKPEIVNIFFAFVCVLLAYQIHAMRAGIRKLQADASEKDEEIVRLRSILANLVSTNDSGGGDIRANDNTFSMRLATKCAEVVKNIFYESEKRVGYSWILGKKLASGNALEVENLVNQLEPVILSEMQLNVGDAAFTPEELKERHVAALKILKSKSETSSAQQHLLDGDVSTQPSIDVGDRSAQMHDLMGILEEVHKQDIPDVQNAKSDEDGNNSAKVVRRTRYAI